MYFVHAADRCTRKLSSPHHFTDKQACAPLPDLLWAVHRSPPSPVPQPQAGPQVGPHLTGDSGNVTGIPFKKEKRKQQLCVLCSLECKAYFIPYEPNSLQSLDALVVRCRWKLSCRGCLFWHPDTGFGAWSVDGWLDSAEQLVPWSSLVFRSVPCKFQV